MKKRFLLTLLAIALVLSVMAVTVTAAVYRNIKTPQIIYGDYESETITVDGTGADLPYSVSSEVSVSKVEGTQITLSGVVANMKYSLNGGSAVTMKAANIADGEYVITGLEEGVTYSITLTYNTRTNVNSSGHNYMFAASNAIEVKTLSLEDGGKWPTPEGLATKNGVITGLVDGQTYMYAPVTLPAGTVGAYAEYIGATLANGVYNVYIAAGNDGQYKYTDSDPVAVLVEGDRVGKLSLAYMNGTTLTGYTDHVVGAGKWTFVSPLGNIKPGFLKSHTGFATQITMDYQHQIVSGSYVYNFLASEYVLADDFVKFSFKKTNNQGDHIRNLDGTVPQDIVGAFIIHVFDGEAKEYKVPFTWDAIASNSITIDAASVLSGVAGVVYKIEIDFIDLSDVDVAITDITSLETALGEKGYRLSKMGGGYKELGGKQYTIAEGEYLYYKDYNANNYVYVGTGGEFVLDPNGEKLKFTEGYELKAGEYVTIHHDDATLKEISYLDATELYVMTGCSVASSKTARYRDDYTYQELRFTTDTDVFNVLYDVRQPEAKPDYVYFEGNGTVEGDETTNKYLIKGLDETKVYMIAIGNGAYTKVENVTEYEVTGTKGVATKYSIYVAGGATTYDSEVFTKTITDAYHAIPDELTITTETDGMSNTHYYVGIFADAKENNYTVEYIIQGESWDDSSKATAQETIEVKPGKSYLFRYAQSGNVAAGAAVNVFVKGIVNDESLKGTVSTSYDGTSRTFVSGKWVFSHGTIYVDGNPGNRFATSWAANMQDAANIAWLYEFTVDEMFALSELSAFNIVQQGVANAKQFNTDIYTGFARIHVAAGDKSYYDVPTVFEHNGAYTVDVASLWDDEVAADENFQPKGYVTAIELHYFAPDKLEGIEVVKTAVDYPVFKIAGWKYVANNDPANRSTEFVTLKTVPSIDTLDVAPAIGEYGGEITGFLPSATYQIVEVDPDTLEPVADVITASNVTYVPLKAGTYAVRVYAPANDKKYATSEYTYLTIDTIEADGRTSAKMDKIVLPEDVVATGADYTFDINESRWINRLAISNIVHESPNAVITFAANDYKYVIEAANIDLSLDTAHYFDMKVTFDGESAYDRMYSKMAAVADEKELVKGIHFETSTNYFFETATFMVRLGTQFDGYEVELRSFNDRVNRLRSEETVTVEDGWATFSTFGGDYVILSPAYAADNQ
ncbi:MAG: hypothetical protein IJP16_07150 [Clostridia bacterium]|nr:hypothetical protein [Clostridia bacterium]